MMKRLDEKRSSEYAKWFRCLSEPTRVRILNLVALSGKAMTVGEIVEVVEKSQSTVSRHLQVLADSGFVFVEQDGVRSLVTVNRKCMSDLPRAAAEIMGVAGGRRR